MQSPENIWAFFFAYSMYSNQNAATIEIQREILYEILTTTIQVLNHDYV